MRGSLSSFSLPHRESDRGDNKGAGCVVAGRRAAFLVGLLGRYDRVPVDSWTIAQVAENYMKGRKPTVRQVERLYERHGQWRQLVWWFEQWLTWGTAQAMLEGQRQRRFQWGLSLIGWHAGAGFLSLCLVSDQPRMLTCRSRRGVLTPRWRWGL